MAGSGNLYSVAAANVQMQTGIPPGPGASDAASSLPGLADALQGVATQHGLLGALLVIAIGAIATLWFRSNKSEAEHAEEREDWQQQIQQLNKDRLSDQREIVTALQNATGVISVNSQRMAETAGTTHEIASKLAEVVQITRGNAEVLKINQEAILWLTRNRLGGPTGGGA